MYFAQTSTCTVFTRNIWIASVLQIETGWPKMNVNMVESVKYSVEYSKKYLWYIWKVVQFANWCSFPFVRQLNRECTGRLLCANSMKEPWRWAKCLGIGWSNKIPLCLVVMNVDPYFLDSQYELMSTLGSPALLVTLWVSFILA